MSSGLLTRANTVGQKKNLEYYYERPEHHCFHWFRPFNHSWWLYRACTLTVCLGWAVWPAASDKSGCQNELINIKLKELAPENFWSPSKNRQKNEQPASLYHRNSEELPATVRERQNWWLVHGSGDYSREKWTYHEISNWVFRMSFFVFFFSLSILKNRKKIRKDKKHFQSNITGRKGHL